MVLIGPFKWILEYLCKVNINFIHKVYKSFYSLVHTLLEY